MMSDVSGTPQNTPSPKTGASSTNTIAPSPVFSFLKEAEKLIGTDSTYTKGNEAAAAQCASIMRSMGFKVQLQPVMHSFDSVSKRQVNLIGSLGDPLVDGTTKRGLMLTAHLDTASPWGEDAAQLTIEKDRLSGLGTANAKLNFLCIIKACEILRNRIFKQPLYVVGLAGGEIGAFGAKFLVKSYAVNPRAVVVGEPTNLQAIARHKSVIWYRASLSFSLKERDAKGFNTRIVLKTKSFGNHAANQDQEKDAFFALVSAMQDIQNANFDVRLTELKAGEPGQRISTNAIAEFFIPTSSFEEFRRFAEETLLPKFSAHSQDSLFIEYGGLGESGVRFLPQDLMIVVQKIMDRLQNSIHSIAAATQTMSDALSGADRFYPHGTTACLLMVDSARPSSFPGTLDLDFEVRLLPSMNVDDFDKKLRDQWNQLSGEFPQYNLKIMRQGFNPGLDIENSPLLDAAKDLLGEDTKISATRSDAQNFVVGATAGVFHAAGYEVVAFGPGSPDVSHKKNEFVPVEHLDRAIEFYIGLIERHCL